MLGLVACNDLENDPYFKNGHVNNVNTDVISTDQTVAEYVQSRADLSKMSNLFAETGIYEEMPNSGELHTLLVVCDQNFEAPDAENSVKVARSHVTNISISPSKLNDGDRLLMWHNKYVTVGLDSIAQEGTIIGHTKFNQSFLSEVVKAQDGFIYIIDKLIFTPTSMQDYVESKLDSDRFSRFKQMISSSSGEPYFDREHSKVLGVDDKGNTIYDSVLVYTNAFFDAKGFNLSNESLKGTMFVFSDEVINAALAEARGKLKAWGYDDKILLRRNGSLDSLYLGYTSDKDLENWILQAAFYREKYTPEQLTPNMDAAKPTDNDIKSIYDIIWRTSVQELDLDNPIELSNGIVYEVKSFRIPNNRLVYRYHEEFRNYEYCDADQKALYFKSENLKNFKTTLSVEGWTPLPGVWDPHANYTLNCAVDDVSSNHYQLNFTPIYSRPNADGGYDVKPVKVIPGAYRMAMGFAQNMSDLAVQLCAVDAAGDITECGDVVPLSLADGSTTWHYDRGATLSNSLPEFYNKSDERFDQSLKSKFAYYWTDGGPVYPEVIVPDLNGDGSPVQLLIRLIGSNGKTAKTLTLNHWCLRPTENNY